MPKPFDATLKGLAHGNPRAFLAAFDRPPPASLSLLNVDLSTVTTAAEAAFATFLWTSFVYSDLAATEV